MAVSAVSDIKAEDIIEAWNELAKRKKLSRVLSTTPKRGQSINARLRDSFFRDNWKAALAKIGESDFCTGVNDRQWTANLDWFIRPDICVKIIEGKYDNKKTATKERKDHEQF